MYACIPIRGHEDGVIMHVLYVKMKVNVQEHLFFNVHSILRRVFFVVEVVFVCTEAKIMWTVEKWLDHAPNSWNQVLKFEPHIHYIHPATSSWCHMYCRLLKQRTNCGLPGADVSCLTDCFFPFQKDSPSKVSVAELAGRFKGHILPMPTSNDEVLPDNSCRAQILVSSQPGKQHTAIFSE